MLEEGRLRPVAQQGPLGQYGIARSLVQTPGGKALEAEQNEMLPRGGGGGGMSFRMGGGGGRSGFDWGNYPTKLDGSQLSYGLPSIWAGDMTTAETNKWADTIAATGVDPLTGRKLSQFEWNTFTDPMAKRKGLGVYNIDFNNPLNRPKEQLTQEYRDKVAAFNSPENVARMQAGANLRRDIKSAEAKRNFAALGGGARNVISPLASRQSRQAIARAGGGSISGRGGRGNVGARVRAARKAKSTVSPGWNSYRRVGGR